MAMKSREIRLKQVPQGLPRAADFEIVETELPGAGPGGLIVRNLWLTVDPYMRGRMTGIDSYVPGFRVGQVMGGGAIGRVVRRKAIPL
jgi:NADPH-dependent curcumin reductase CurA